MPDVTVIQPDPLLPQYRWNPNARHGLGAHIDSNGRFVSRATVRAELDNVIKGLGDQASTITGQLKAGEVTLSDWQTQMMAISKQSAMVGAVMQKGSWFNMTQSDFGRVGQQVKEQYGFLRDWAKGIAEGVRKIHRGVARQYAQFGRQVYYLFEKLKSRLGGLNERRNILHARESCSGVGSCIEQNGLGWLSINDDQFIEIGRRVCRGNCLCTWEYRNSETGAKVTA
ncbi:MAG: hypothetical protein GY938_16550 [Ketobacter sp.]|nr:hypothetical protein [Ketobacter sp.]